MRPRDPEVTRWWGWKDEAWFWGVLLTILAVSLLIFRNLP